MCFIRQITVKSRKQAADFSQLLRQFEQPGILTNNPTEMFLEAFDLAIEIPIGHKANLGDKRLVRLLQGVLDVARDEQVEVVVVEAQILDGEVGLRVGAGHQ